MGSTASMSHTNQFGQCGSNRQTALQSRQPKTAWPITCFSQQDGGCRNKLDLVIVVLALADIFTSSDSVSSVSSVFRIFRVVRLAKVLQQVK